MKKIIVETIKETKTFLSNDIGRVMDKLMQKIKGGTNGVKVKLLVGQMFDSQK